MAIVPRKTGNGYIFFVKRRKMVKICPVCPLCGQKKNEKWAENYEQIVNK